MARVFTDPKTGQKYIQGPFGQRLPIVGSGPTPLAPLPNVPGSSPANPVHLGPQPPFVPSVIPPAPPTLPLAIELVNQPVIKPAPTNPVPFIPTAPPTLPPAPSMPLPSSNVVPPAPPITSPTTAATDAAEQRIAAQRAADAANAGIVAGNASVVANTPAFNPAGAASVVAPAGASGDMLDQIASSMTGGPQQTPQQAALTGDGTQAAGMSPVMMFALIGVAAYLAFARKGRR